MNEDKQTGNLVSFDPANFEMPKIYQLKGIFNPNAVWHSYFLIPGQSFHRKRAKLLERFFSPALQNAIWSSLLEY